MGTVNFARPPKTVDDYYIVTTTHLEYYEVDALKHNLISQIESLSSFDTFDNDDIIEPTSYLYLTTIYTSKTYGDIDVEIHINCYIEHGYYENDNLTFKVEYGYNGYMGEYDSIKDFIEDIWGINTSMNKGMIRIQQKSIKKWVDKQSIELIKETNNILKTLSDD